MNEKRAADKLAAERREANVAKDFLSRAFYLDQRIRAKRQQIHEIQCLAGDSVCEGNNESALGLIDEYAEQLNELIRVKKEITDVIARVEPCNYKLFLELRYEHFMMFKHIAAEMNSTEDYIKQMHRKVLAAAYAVMAT
ncbi:MAG: hypothetical protein FWF47_06795 [Clostridia bacterium]|nr:hypothetical protein [Clostridia bacterium]